MSRRLRWFSAMMAVVTICALGLGQFVKATWLDMIRRYHPELAQGRSDAEILDLRKKSGLFAIDDEEVRGGERS